ncbi:MAG TPA: o-succinylbenzoate synthase [Dermatophilaceae bacterium]|nr:o-succinylbenzoate synthase [Dermatophilaceae bacterium]
MPTGPPGLLPSAEELLTDAHVVRIPLRTRFRGLTHRESLLVRGPVGWAEFNPFVEYDDPEAARWLQATIEAGWVGWPPPVRDRVPVNATVPAVPPDDVPSVLARFDGCDTAKVKVAEPGQSLSDDMDRVASTREVMGPQGRIRVDANGGWATEQAVAALAGLARFGLEYAEQPCPSVEELAAVRVGLAARGVDVPIAADESIRKVEDPIRVRRLGAADLIVVKAPPLGGVRSALNVIAAVGLPAVVSSALDTSVGIGAGVALAAALPELGYACGLGTARLYGGDVTTEPLVAVAGMIAVRPVMADPELLHRWQAPPQRQDWWLDRLRRCRAVLASSVTEPA